MYIQFSTLALALTYSISSASAANCEDNGTFQTSDANTLVNQIQTNSIPNATISSSVPLKATSSKRFASNAANSNTGPVFCLNNNFLFDNTHDALSDIASAASDIVSQCCTSDSCTGGTFQIKGDTGLDTDLVLQIGTKECENNENTNTFSDIGDGINEGVDFVADQAFGDPLDPFGRR